MPTPNHTAAKRAAITILEAALAAARAGRTPAFLDALKDLGFEHTYAPGGHTVVWEPADLTAANARRGSRGILGAQFFTLYEDIYPTHSRLVFVLGRIGNTSTYALATDNTERIDS